MCTKPNQNCMAGCFSLTFGRPADQIPQLAAAPGKTKPGPVANGIVSHLDWLPTPLTMAGDPDVTEKLL
jgi:arylsulfatase A-like enzyme